MTRGLGGASSRRRHRTSPGLGAWLSVAVPSLVAGAGLSFSLPPFGFWIVAFPAASILWWRLDSLSLGRRILAGWAAGLGLFVPGLWWALSFNVYGGVILMFVQALAPALACAFVPPGRGRALALPGAMVLVEALRGNWPFGGLPIGGVALGQAGGPIAYASRLGGPLLLVGMVWLAGVGPGLLGGACAGWLSPLAATGGMARARGWFPESRPWLSEGRRWSPLARAPRRAWRLVGGLLAMAAVGGVAGWGSVSPDGGAAVRHLRVAAVQGGGARGLRKAQVPPSVVFDAQVAANSSMESAQESRGTPPALLLWPEDVVSLSDRLDVDPAKQQLASIAENARATLVVGVTESVSSTRFRNEIVVFSPAGRIVDRFEKVHRVPFGEYVPFRGFFEHFASLSAVPQDAIPGHGNGLLRTPAGPLGTMVSYEVFFPGRGRVATRAGAQLLVLPTNTSSYATSQVPAQEIAAARLQALSEGRDLVEASPTGFSSFIDNRGDVLARTSLGVRRVLVRDVALRTGHTVYERTGDLPVLALAGALVVAGWLSYALSDTSSPRAEYERRSRSARGSG